MHENASPLLLPQLLRTLHVSAGHWNELLDAAGAPRAMWQRFFTLLGDEGMARLDQAVSTAALRVRGNDVSYNAHAGEDAARAWALDVLPLLVDEQEWATIAQGVVQRARLMNALVTDIYSAQALLQCGLLPGALVFDHPGYLRAMKGAMPHARQFVQIMAVDLARAPDGQWTVLAHHTEAPSGLGYTLENRQIIANLFSDAFREMRISSVMPSYSHLAAMLTENARAMLHADPAHDAPRDVPRDVPHIALLSSGTHSQNYFEQAYLARHLGLTLVGGKDLTVRGDKLYLKTLAGLERVHGLLRCVDDVFCDPLELRNDSALGVPGLLQVIRADNVIVTNTPGAGFVQSCALHGFLPAISQVLLGEPLALPTVATREEQAALAYSCAPRYEHGALDARPAVLRVYAFAGQHGAWHVMPGGFTRLASAPRASMAMQSGGSSVDTWVLSSQTTPVFPLQPMPMKPADLAQRRQRPVSSRAAENLFWSGRYSERSENNVRLCRLILGTLGSDEASGLLGALVDLAAHSGLLVAGGATHITTPIMLERELIGHLGGTRARNTGIGQNLASQTAACSEIRDRLSSDHWRSVLAARNDFYDALERYAPEADNDQGQGQGEPYNRIALMSALEKLSLQLAAISGAQGDRMMRDTAWRLLFIGRHIERVSIMAMYLRVVNAHGLLAQHEAFDLLLQLFDSTFTYRSLYPGQFEVPALLDLLVVEPINPRGLYGVYQRLRAKLDEIPRTASHRHRALFLEQMPAVDSLPGLDLLCQRDADGRYPVLAATCEQLRAQVAWASSEISVRYFSHAAESPEMTLQRSEKARNNPGRGV